MRIFGTFLPPDVNMNTSSYQKGSSRGIYGAGVATQQFMTSLLRYGNFNEYHLFDPNRYTRSKDGEAEELFGFIESDARLKLFLATEFEEALQKNDYLAFHRPRGPYIAPMIYLRNQLITKNIPITGVTHTISYHGQLIDFLTFLLIDARPWDSIVCLEEPARRVMKNHFTHLQTRFSEHFGVDLKYEGRLDSIPLGVDTQTYRQRDKQALRQQFGFPRDKVILLWVGRFSHYDKMDLQPLLLAFKAALEKCSKNEALLVLAGDDSRHNYAEKVTEFAMQLGIEKHLITLTDRPRIDFPLLYSAADIFVSPSDNIQETFGQTVLEGMSSGLPVVCSDWEGYSVSVLHGKTGFRIPTYWMECDGAICDYAPISPWLFNQFYLSQSICFNVQQMAEALFLLIEHDKLRAKMGGQARQHVLDTYDWKIIIHRYIELWEELSQIASCHPVPARRFPSWFRPQYFKTFEHYATATLQPTTKVRITDSELVSFPEDTPAPWYEELNTKLAPELLNVLLSMSNDWITITELEENLSGPMNISTEKIRYHLLWLLKYHRLTLNVDTIGQEGRELATAYTIFDDATDFEAQT
ncbi:MAG: glycosyltransferase family 4 protein [Candidatus Poribacteria bacterium]|nr:glycosyltransferase family 4 protein [Candidatus Poribacteria bacterium]